MRQVCPECHKRGMRWVADSSTAGLQCLYCGWHSLDVACAVCGNQVCSHGGGNEYRIWEVNHLACDRKPLAWFVQVHRRELDGGERLMQATVYLHYEHKQYKVYIHSTDGGDAECPYGAHVRGTRRRPNMESVREGWYRVPSFGREVDLQLAAARAVGARFLLGVGSSKYDLERKVEVS